MPEIEAQVAPEGVMDSPDSGQASPDISGNVATPSPQADPKFNPQDWAYTFRSETVQPKSREEMIELLQMGHSYRHNKPKWDEQQKEFSEKGKTYEQYEKLQQALEGNPAFRDELMEMYNRHNNGQQPQQEQAGDPRVDELHQKVTTWEERAADAELNQELDQVQAKYPEVQWNKDLGEGTPRQQLVKFMAERRINNPEDAYWAMFGPRTAKTMAHQAAAKTTQNIKQQHRSGVVATDSAVKPDPKVDHSKMSWDQLTDMAVAEFKGR